MTNTPKRETMHKWNNTKTLRKRSITQQLRSAFMYIVTRLISDVHFHITWPKLTFKTYYYRHCDTSMYQKNADYFPSGGVIATLLVNCNLPCYANMNVTLFRVSANQISVFSITQQSRLLYQKISSDNRKSRICSAQSVRELRYKSCRSPD